MGIEGPFWLKWDRVPFVEWGTQVAPFAKRNSPGRHSVSPFWFLFFFFFLPALYWYNSVSIIYVSSCLFVMLLISSPWSGSVKLSFLPWALFWIIPRTFNSSHWLGAHCMEGMEVHLIRAWQNYGCLTENLQLIIAVAHMAKLTILFCLFLVGYWLSGRHSVPANCSHIAVCSPFSSFPSQILHCGLMSFLTVTSP